MPTNLKTQQCPQDWKRSVFITIPKRGNAKEWSNCHTVMLILHASKVMLKILQVRLHHEPRTSRCTNWVLKRQRNQRSNCQHSLHHEEGKGFQKNIYFCFIDYAKAFDFVDHYKLWKILRFGNTRPPYLSLRNVYACQE